MTVTSASFSSDLQRGYRADLERHLVDVGFRDPPEHQRRRQPPGAHGSEPSRPVEKRAFAAAVLLTPLLQIGPMAYFAALGAPVYAESHGLVGTALAIVAGLFWLIGMAAVVGLPVYLLAAPLLAWRALGRLKEPTASGAARAVAPQAFGANLLTLPIFGLIAGLNGADLSIAVLIAGGAFALGMLFAPLQGAILGALYVCLSANQPKGATP